MVDAPHLGAHRYPNKRHHLSKKSQGEPMKAQRGLVFLAALVLVATIAVVALASYRHMQDKERRRTSEARAAELRRSEEQQQKRRAEEEKQELDARLAAAQARTSVQKATDGLDALYKRWKDAALLASSTSRIALAVPMASLQAIKRDAEALEVSACFTPAKERLISGMAAFIEGMVAFMQDATIGKTIAEGMANAASKDFSSYEAITATCKAQAGR